MSFSTVCCSASSVKTDFGYLGVLIETISIKSFFNGDDMELKRKGIRGKTISARPKNRGVQRYFTFMN